MRVQDKVLPQTWRDRDFERDTARLCPPGAQATRVVNWQDMETKIVVNCWKRGVNSLESERLPWPQAPAAKSLTAPCSKHTGFSGGDPRSSAGPETRPDPAEQSRSPGPECACIVSLSSRSHLRGRNAVDGRTGLQELHWRCCRWDGVQDARAQNTGKRLQSFQRLTQMHNTSRAGRPKDG